MIRSGSREKKKTLLGGSGSGDLDDVTEALQGLPTVLYPTPTLAASADTIGNGIGLEQLFTSENLQNLVWTVQNRNVFKTKTSVRSI